MFPGGRKSIIVQAIVAEKIYLGYGQILFFIGSILIPLEEASKSELATFSVSRTREIIVSKILIITINLTETLILQKSKSFIIIIKCKPHKQAQPAGIDVVNVVSVMMVIMMLIIILVDYTQEAAISLIKG